MEFIGLLLIVTVGLLFLSIKIIPQQQMGVVERLGKFSRIMGPGLNFVIPLIERVAGKESIRIRQLDVPVETKTKDNVFVNLGVSVQFIAVSDKIFDAFYRLTDVELQITSYVYDVVRGEVPKKTLDEVFETKEDLAQIIKADLSDSMDDFGYSIIKSLITDIDPAPNVKSAMNQINATARLLVAAQNEAEADKIRQVKSAEAEAESKKLQGEGIAQQRAAIIEGFKDSINDLKQVTGSEVETQDVMNMVMMVQYFDALRDIGTSGQNNAVLIPYGAGGSNQIFQQMTQAMITSDQIRRVTEEGTEKPSATPSVTENGD
ncbi:MAG: SPFH domain-containing protein [Dehalococcoidia bacterium]|nr:SPFH domain-containing protein [Chloroflexota bacterium]MCH2525514.1 SPFH domain-containing protein [Dehalococcoidia bacterium]MQF99347.1 SPFH domain-containing protein [SAR202 cluster bacterium]|tara:strand:- start:683 stop:1639 length:957 start_codon:yes stop_codon:yes gene_type:complete